MHVLSATDISQTFNIQVGKYIMQIMQQQFKDCQGVSRKVWELGGVSAQWLI